MSRRGSRRPDGAQAREPGAPRPGEGQTRGAPDDATLGGGGGRGVSVYNDFRMAQIKSLAFLTVIARSSNLQPLMQPQEQHLMPQQKLPQMLPQRLRLMRLRLRQQRLQRLQTQLLTHLPLIKQLVEPFYGQIILLRQRIRMKCFLSFLVQNMRSHFQIFELHI